MNIEKEKSVKKKFKNITTEEISDNGQLSPEELISKLILLSKNKQPYSVKKEVENIKSLFYIKINQFNTENINRDNNKEEKITTANQLEKKFKKIYDIYRKIKSDYRKQQEKKENLNLKEKKAVIKKIEELTKEKETIRTTFYKFRKLQEEWRNLGHVPLSQKDHIWKSYQHKIEVFYDFIKINNDLRDIDFRRNLEKKEKIIKEAKKIFSKHTINYANKKLQELHEEWKRVGPVEKNLRNSLWQNFQNISRKINKKSNDYFTLKKIEDVNKLNEKNFVAREIKELGSKKTKSYHQWEQSSKKCKVLEKKWKNIGKLSTKSNKIAWNNLREGLTVFYENKNNFYKERKIQNQKVLENKLMICQKAENLKNSTDWKFTSEKLIKLQKQWENLEYSSSAKSNIIWKKFKSACDFFFKAKKEYNIGIKKKEEKILKHKKELIKKLKIFNTSDSSENNTKKIEDFISKWNNINCGGIKTISLDTIFFDLLKFKYQKLGLKKEKIENEQFNYKLKSIKENVKLVTKEKQEIKGKINTLKQELVRYENNMSFFSSSKATIPLLNQSIKKIDNIKSKISKLENNMKLLNTIK